MTDYFKARERDMLFRRIEQLTPDMRTRDQRVTAHETICHLIHSLREYCGELAPSRSANIFQRTLGKWLVFHLLPWPERPPKTDAQRAEFLGSAPPRDFASDHAEFVRLLQLFEERCNHQTLAPHPVYGKLNRAEWGQYLFLHLDFHLTAFGIHGQFIPHASK
jgi:hypothetical protein